MGKVIEELVVKLKLEGKQKVQNGIEETGKKTKKTGQVMEKTSKKFGLAFKAAGLFAVGLFASVLKGGPVTAKFIGNIWSAIGLLGDTLLQKAGAWEVLGTIQDGLLKINEAVQTGDITHLAEILKKMAIDLFKFKVPSLSFLTNTDEIKEKFANMKTFVSENVSSLIEFMKEKWSGFRTWSSENLKKISEWAKAKFIDMRIAWANLMLFLRNKMNSTAKKVREIVDKLKTYLQDRFQELRNEYDRLKNKLSEPIRITRIIDTIRGRLPTAQIGGQISAGKTHLVGERGPELFTPTSSGNITPNRNLGGAGGDTVINMTLELDGRSVWESVKRVSALDMRRLGGA